MTILQCQIPAGSLVLEPRASDPDLAKDRGTIRKILGKGLSYSSVPLSYLTATSSRTCFVAPRCWKSFFIFLFLALFQFRSVLFVNQNLLNLHDNNHQNTTENHQTSTQVTTNLTTANTVTNPVVNPAVTNSAIAN